MRQLVAQSSLDLFGEQSAIVAEISLQRVAVDHDSVLVALARHTVAEVMAVGMGLRAAIGDNHRDVFQHFLELIGQCVDRIDNQRFELVEVKLACHVTTVKAPELLDGGAGIDYVRFTAEGSRPILATIGRAKCEIAS
jgi:hypothetical protein